MMAAPLGAVGTIADMKTHKTRRQHELEKIFGITGEYVELQFPRTTRWTFLLDLTQPLGVELLRKHELLAGISAVSATTVSPFSIFSSDHAHNSQGHGHDVESASSNCSRGNGGDLSDDDDDEEDDECDEYGHLRYSHDDSFALDHNHDSGGGKWRRGSGSSSIRGGGGGGQRAHERGVAVKRVDHNLQCGIAGVQRRCEILKIGGTAVKTPEELELAIIKRRIVSAEFRRRKIQEQEQLKTKRRDRDGGKSVPKTNKKKAATAKAGKKSVSLAANVFAAAAPGTEEGAAGGVGSASPANHDNAEAAMEFANMPTPTTLVPLSWEEEALLADEPDLAQRLTP